jgi:hypothetical protein
MPHPGNKGSVSSAGTPKRRVVRGRHREWATVTMAGILMAVAPYLAAHSLTERAALQTADVARRLMLGGEFYRTN